MTDRKTIDQITSDELDQLYEQLAAEQADNAALRRWLLRCSHREARDRAEATIARVRALESGLWQVDDQRDMKVSAVCHSVANDLRAALDEPAPGPDTTATQATETTARVFAGLHRSAEQDVTRVIDLYEQWVKAGPPPLGVLMSRWWDARLSELRGAIRPAADEPQGTTPNNPPTSKEG